MRLRTIKPGFFQNDVLAELPPLARLLYAGLWCLADREGRLEDRPKRIKVEILPYDSCDVDKLLTALATKDFIVRYESGGNHYIAIPAFSRHQNPHVKEANSRIPSPSGSSTVQAPDKHSAGTNLGTVEPGSPMSCLVSMSTIPPPVGEAGSGASKEQQQPSDVDFLLSFHARAAKHWKANANVNPDSKGSRDGFTKLLKRAERDKVKRVLTWFFRGEDGDYAPKGEFDWRPNLLSGHSIEASWDKIEVAFDNAFKRETEGAPNGHR